MADIDLYQGRKKKMLVGQLIIGMFLGVASGIYAYLALDLSLWMALAIYSGVGASAALMTAVSIVLFMGQEQPESAPAGSLAELDSAG